MKPKRGWEKNETQIIWLSEILENCRCGWKSQSVVQGMYRTAPSQGAAWHCTAVNTACSQGAEKNIVVGGIQTGQENSKDVPPTLCWMMWVNSGVGWRIYQIQLELVLSWATEWCGVQTELCRCPGRSCALLCCLLGTSCALTLAAAFGIGHP